jgi:DNA-binding NtrC family response regulator
MKTILVIEDDTGFQLLLKKMLERQGYQVLLASNGNEGMKIIREYNTDLIVTDIIMPEKDGIEVIREVVAEYPKIKIIALSGGGRINADTYIEMASKLGAHRTIFKPFKQELLLTTVRELLGME